MRPLVIVSDVHLGHHRCDAVASDLARLVAMHPGHEIILNGDTFNLACDPPDRHPAASAAAMIAAHPSLRTALARHIAAGDPLTFIAGNHDIAIQHPDVRARLVALLAEGKRADLSIEPWIVRRADVHIEHGHLYDPGNSPTHPLSVPARRGEPLGVALTRRFVGPWDAWDLLANQWAASINENMKLFVAKFGARTPLVVLHYCALLVAINAETAVPSRLTRDRQRGHAALPAYAAAVGLPESALHGLLAGRLQPLHVSFWHTFLRFGFDAALALIAIAGGVVAALVLRRLEPLAVSAIGIAFLALDRKRLEVRGANHMPEELRAGAAFVHHLTDARLVILGHTHREDEMQGYLNLGAFGDRPSPARTFVHVDEEGRAERRQLPPEV
jgi:UDP-2,3-diacylglucosamine pyrophosphatase LpxH